MNQRMRRALRVLFILYGLLMLWLLFGQRFGSDLPGTYWERVQNNVNLVPFRTIKEFIHTIGVTTSPYLIRHSVINLGGNVVMFVPLGFFPPCIWNTLRSFARCMLGAAVCILIIELIQLFTLLGSCDVDDLILNMVGVAIGYGLYRLFNLFFVQERNLSTGGAIMDFREIEKVLSGAVMDLKPATIPDEAVEFEMVTLDRTEEDNSRWLSYVAAALDGAKTFEIHCWNEEAAWIELALRYGKLKEDDWKYGKIIIGDVTPEFVRMLLSLPKPTDIEIENKMTPFFNVFLDDHFQSCHYGTELYI